MTRRERITLLAQRFGTEIKALYAALNGKAPKTNAIFGGEFIVDTPNLIFIGDYAGQVNGTLIYIDDETYRIHFFGNVLYSDSLILAARAGNGTRMAVIDPNGEIISGVEVSTLAAKALDIRTFSGTTDTLVLADLGKEIRASSASAKIVTIAPTATLGTNFICAVCNLGVGNLTFAPGTNVTLRNNTGGLAQHKTATVRAIGTNDYVITGEMA